MALVALLKHAFDAPRPLTVLTQAGIWDSIVLVEGHPLRDTLSFPSGHTAAAFSLFTTLALFSTRWWIKTLLFFAALAVAYSRIYLMQHFISDVLAGSFLATLISVAVYLWAREARWIDFGRPLVSLRRYGRPEKPRNDGFLPPLREAFSTWARDRPRDFLRYKGRRIPVREPLFPL